MAHFIRISKHIGITILSVILLTVNAQNPDSEHDLVANLRHAHTVKTAAHKYTRDANQGTPDELRNLLADTADAIAARAEEILANGLTTDAGNSTYEVSEKCLNHTEMVLVALIEQQPWALRMVDAMGKPASDIMDGSLVWVGSYDECIDVLVNDTTNQTGLSTPFNGRYCRSSFCLAPPCTMPGMSLSLAFGICVPNSCSSQDANGLVNTLLSLIPFNSSSLPPPTTVCQLDDLELSGKAIAVITVCSIFAAILVLGTAYDILVVQGLVTNLCYPGDCELEKVTPSNYGAVAQTDTIMNGGPVSDKTPLLSNGHVTQNGAGPHHRADTQKIDIEHSKTHVVKPKTTSSSPGALGKLLLSFSMYSNARKILSTSQPAGTLSAVNGIRFLSMTWVILGHSYVFGLQTVVLLTSSELDRSSKESILTISYKAGIYVGNTSIDKKANLATFMPEMIKRLTFQAIGNGTVSVDTFFALSGLLLAYLSLKEMKKVGGAKKFKWGMYYFHRFWRLTPPYMLFLMMYVPTIKYWYNGPMWSQTGIEIDECRESWWTNLLYINNVVRTDKMCMGWSWYLANDMQFFVVSPLLLIPLYYSPLLGLACCTVFILATFITTGVVSAHYSLHASMLLQAGGTDYMNHYYMKPWCRIGPYVIGIIAGYILYKTDCKIRMPKIINVLGWTIATVTALLVVYGLWDPDTGIQDFSTGLSALYNATSRTAWGACVCWVIIACATGHGGPVNKLLSWPAIIPLSRLTYCAYLVHPVVQTVYAMSRRTLMYWYDLQMIYLFIGHLFIAYSAAFLLSLAFESPMMGLEKLLLGRKKSS